MSFAEYSDFEVEREAQLAAERHLRACGERLDAHPETPVRGIVAPFCGCPTCVVREVLHAAWPAVWELARRGARRRII